MAKRKSSSKNSPKKIVFKKHAQIGALDAVEDRDFLLNCFVDTGEYDIISSTRDPRSILLGRTGSGKTALIEVLKNREDHVTELDPETLALTYVANHSALSFYGASGVKIDIFYRMLWRHILVIEILRLFLDNNSPSKNKSLFERIELMTNFKKSSHRAGRDYLLKYRDTYWKSTDYRVTNFTKTLETDVNNAVKAGLKGKLPDTIGAEFSVNKSTAEKLTEEQKGEIVKYAQPVVDRVQIRKLAEAIKFLELELLDDPQQKYFIVIDRLDEPWVNDGLRYKLNEGCA